MNIGTLTGQLVIEDEMTGVLKSASLTIRQFSNTFDGATKTLAVGAAVATSALAGVAAAVINLGEKGSVILGVEEAFDRLAKAAGSSGEAMVGALSEGVRGTIDSLELMQATTKLLASGMKITEDDMRVMAATAREMGKATGQDAAAGLNILSSALQTGNLRSLKRFGINIDLVKSEKDFAASLGTTRDELSATGRLEAHRIAILDAARKKLDQYGESQLSFKERLQQANVAIGNWFDNLAKGVASSANVNRAFDTIAKSFVDTFGASSQDLLQAIITQVNNFADAVAKFGPTIIQALGRVKDWIVNVWNELVNFNERYRITENLVAGARFAWSLLETAFRLVETAVQRVIKAWQEMPEWLRRIASTAVQATIAVTAFSVGVGAVAAPVGMLISKIDLAINIFGNLTGAIFASTQLWPMLVKQYTAATAALNTYVVSMRMTTAVSKLEIIATESVTLAKMTLAAATNVVTFAFTTLAARIQMSTIYLTAHALAVNVVKIAQAAWAIVVAAVSTAYTGLITRLGLTRAAMIASTGATIATKIAMEALGFAILGVQAIPIVAALTGLVLALNEVRKAFIDLFAAWERGKSTWDVLSARDTDTWARRWLNYVSQFVAGVDILVTKVEEANKRLKGGAVTTEFNPTITPGALAGGSAEMIAAREAREKKEAERQGRFGFTDRDTESFVKGSTVAEDFAKKVRDLGKAFEITVMGMDAFTEAFKRLTPAQKLNLDLQRELVPEIDRLIESNKKLAPGMQEVRFAAQAAEQALRAKDDAILEASGLTLTQIDQMKKLGMTEVEIAHNYDVTTAALGRRITKLSELETNAKNLATFESKLMEQRERDAKRREDAETKASLAIGQANKELNDLLLEGTISTTDAQIRQIEREKDERIAAFTATAAASGRSVEQIAEFVRIQEELSRRRVANLKIDNDVLRQHSRQTLQDIEDKARATYEAAKVDVKNYSAAAVTALGEVLEAAERARRGFVTFGESVGDALKQIPDLLINAFTGGGDLLGAVKALAVSLGKTFAETLGNAMKESIRLAKAGFTDAAKAAANTARAAAAGVGAVTGATAVAAGASGTAALGQVALAAAGVTASAAIAAGSLTGAALAAGALTFGIGAAAVGAALLVKHFFSVSKEVKETRKMVDEFTDALHETLTEQQKIEAGNDKWAATMIAVREAYLLTGKSIAEAEDAVRRLHDTGRPAIARMAAQEIAHNVAIAQNIRGVRQLVQEYLGAGRQIPEAIQKKIDKLVIMGRLTTENAAKLLDLVKDEVPTWDQLTAAADRYGIKLDTLGSKIQGIRLTEVANQIVADWEMFEKAGADMTVVMQGMQDELQDLVTDALKLGVDLPASLKPIIQRFIDAGLLTDEFGEKLTDIGRITFAETLEQKLDRLVDALLDLVDALDGVNSQIDDINGSEVNVNVNVNRNVTTVMDDGERWTPQEVEEPSYYAGGRGRLIQFQPRGTDVRPAMIGPNEVVLNAMQAARYEEGSGGGTAILEIDGEKMAEIIVPKMRKVVKRYGLSRR